MRISDWSSDGCSSDLLAHLPPVVQPSAIALHHRMAVEADDLVEQFGPKAVHHRHHGDERGDAEHHGHKADRGDEEDEAFALPAGDKVALGDHPFIAGQDHRISASESSFPRRRESMNTASYEYGNPASIISGHRRSWIPAFAEIGRAHV